MSIKISTLKTAARVTVVFALIVSLNLLTVSDAFAQRGRGGGGGGRGGGGGGARPQTQSSNRSPSMSRQSAPSQSRPAQRPSTGAPNRAAAQPNRAAAQPNRANPGAGNRPTQGGTPTKGDLNSFLGGSGQSAGTPGAGASGRAAGGNSAVNDFFNHDAGAASNNAAATRSSAAATSGGSLANQRSENIAGRTDTRSDVRDSRGENKDFASDNRQDRVSDRGDSQAARVSTRGETRSTLAEGRGETRSERQTQRGEHADSIRQELENEFDSNHVFDDFWKNNPDAYYKFNQNPAFWTWATVGTMGAFFGGGYSSGSSSEAYYEDGTVQDGEQPIPAEEYASQAEEIVESAPEVENPDDVEWLPLGVFFLAPDSATESTAAPTMFLQLAVSKEGIVAGNFNNKATNEVKSVEGMVDMKSGRAAWTLAGKTTPIMETKVEGLTENETSVLVHFADGTTQQWMMAHMEKPAGDQPADGNQPADGKLPADGK